MVEGSKACWQKAAALVESRISPGGVHVWPFDPSFPVDVRYLVLNRRHDAPLHRPDHLEVVYIKSGKVGYETQDGYCWLKKGDLIVVGQWLRHRCLKTDSREAPIRSVVLSFLPDLIRVSTPIGDDAKYLTPFRLRDTGFLNVVPASRGISGEVVDLIERIHSELPAKSDHSRLGIKTFLKMLLFRLGDYYYYDCRQARTRFGEARRALEAVGPVFELIETRFGDPITAQDAAFLMHMDKWKFMRFFKSAVGLPFHSYLNRFRMAKAQALLLSTDKPISEIAQELGFCDQSYFGVVFRRLVRMTPLRYRRSLSGLSRREPFSNPGAVV